MIYDIFANSNPSNDNSDPWPAEAQAYLNSLYQSANNAQTVSERIAALEVELGISNFQATHVSEEGKGTSKKVNDEAKLTLYEYELLGHLGLITPKPV